MALTTPRDTHARNGKRMRYGLAANAVIFAGALVGLNAGGWLVPASDTAGIKVVGRANESADNTGGANGDIDCEAERGTFAFENSTTNALTAADLHTFAFVEDDETVSGDGGDNDVYAGLVVLIDGGQVWINTELQAAANAPAA